MLSFTIDKRKARRAFGLFRWELTESFEFVFNW